MGKSSLPSSLYSVLAPCPWCPLHVWGCALSSTRQHIHVCPAGLIREGLVQDKFVAPGLLIHPYPGGLGPLMKPTKVDQIQLHAETCSQFLLHILSLVFVTISRTLVFLPFSSICIFSVNGKSLSVYATSIRCKKNNGKDINK